MEIVDEQVRKDILAASGNIIVSASAGSGKTTIMVNKILKKMSEISDHKTVAAITFTVKATEEIKRKSKQIGGNNKFVVMTNDSFVEYEIIRPFLIDAFGEMYNNDFVISYEDSVKSGSFDEGLNILEKSNKLGTYHNIKRNFKFELAKKVLEQSTAAQEYFKSKYTMIFLDEYQDSDTDMHNLFMYIKNVLLIDLFIVGDGKQAIYLWRGAQRNIFNQLENEGMQRFELVTNFRSHFEIVNYANLMHNASQFRDDYSKEVTHVVHCRTNDYVSSINELCESNIVDKNKNITIIANINNDAKDISDNLNAQGFNFVFIPKTPLDDGSENANVLKVIACYLLDDNYSVFDIAEVLRVEQNRTLLNKIDSLLKPLKKLVPLSSNQTKDDISISFFESITKFNNYLGMNITNDEKVLLLDSVTNKYFYPAFIKSNDLHKVMTVFGSKGLEFNQVISFANYYSFNDESKKKNHYVCVTRAEEKFVMMEGEFGKYSEQIGRKLIERGIDSESTTFKLIDHI